MPAMLQAQPSELIDSQRTVADSATKNPVELVYAWHRRRLRHLLIGRPTDCAPQKCGRLPPGRDDSPAISDEDA